MADDRQALQWNVPIVDPKTGYPTPEFIRLLQARRDQLNDAVPMDREINTTDGIQGGGDLTADRTLSLTDTGVAAGAYGTATKVPRVTIDAKGRITVAAEQTDFGLRLIPAGGSTGQVLTKNTGANYDVAWAAGGGGGSKPVLVVNRAASGYSWEVYPVNFATLFLNNVVTDTSGGWDAANSQYVVPTTGLWFCLAKLRYLDNSTGFNYGLGIDTSNTDSPSFVWNSFPNYTVAGPYGVYSRQTLVNTRIMNLTAGDRVRIFSYIDGTTSMYGDKGELTMFQIQ